MIKLHHATIESLRAIENLQNIIDKLYFNDFSTEYELMDWVSKECYATILILAKGINDESDDSLKREEAKR